MPACIFKLTFLNASKSISLLFLSNSTFFVFLFGGTQWGKQLFSSPWCFPTISICCTEKGKSQSNYLLRHVLSKILSCKGAAWYGNLVIQHFPSFSYSPQIKICHGNKKHSWNFNLGAAGKWNIVLNPKVPYQVAPWKRFRWKRFHNKTVL